MIGNNRIFKCKVVRKNNENHKQSGKCSPCVSRLNNLCCKQATNKHIQNSQNKSAF